MASPHVSATRYRIGLFNKLVLQVLVEVRNEFYYVDNARPGTQPTKRVWRDARVEDISSEENA